MTLRPYQQRAVDGTMGWLRTSTESCVIEAATGAGKSHIIAEIAHKINKISAKRVLCTAPSGELVEQNYAKWLATGKPASIYSASVGRKCNRHPVIFGTPITINNNLSKFNDFAMMIIDEAHGITPTILSIINHLRNINPNLRVLGLTATPYRLGSGYIYKIDLQNRIVNENAYFTKQVSCIHADELIKLGYLSPPTVQDTAQAYETDDLKLNNLGKFIGEDKAYEGHGRLTSQIVADVVERAQNRRGVLFFAATVKHAEEVLASLPPALSRIVTGATPKAERAVILKQFKAQQIKYLVNVQTLTTGFDAPHIDVVAVLRRTESAALFQQIIGRGLRLYDGKVDCLVLDYANNIKHHAPDGDIFNPKIKDKTEKIGGERHSIECPKCGTENMVALRDGIGAETVNRHGYFEYGGQEDKTVPVHYGRRCVGVDHKLNRCDHFWFSKECTACGHHNDIAARFCESCKTELVDPNKKLTLEFNKFKRNPENVQTDVIEDFDHGHHVSSKGTECHRLTIYTPWRSFTVWVPIEAKNPMQQANLRAVEMIIDGTAKTVTYQKKDDFYRIIAINRPPDAQLTS